MDKELYDELLLSRKWKRKRRKILRRDGKQCRRCPKKTRLHVHHMYYEWGLAPWEYPNNSLITLCENCHRQEHGLPPIVRGKLKTDKPRGIGGVKKT